MKKNASPTKEQAEVLRRNGKNPVLFAVAKETPYSLIIKNRQTGEFEIVKK